MPRKYPYYFSEEDLRLGCKRCIENVKGLLASAKILNDNVMTQQYALGLYMYAVEEYGKAILLKNAITGTEEKYQIEGWILGDGYPKRGNAHDEKIKAGLHNLPEDCRIMRGIKVTDAVTSTNTETEALPSAKSVTIKRGKQGPYDQLSKPEGLTGRFYDTTNVNIFDHNLDLKTACFYMDWHRDNWKYDVATEPEDLKKNIQCLEDALAKGL